MELILIIICSFLIGYIISDFVVFGRYKTELPKGFDLSEYELNLVDKTMLYHRRMPFIARHPLYSINKTWYIDDYGIIIPYTKAWRAIKKTYEYLNKKENENK